MINLRIFLKFSLIDNKLKEICLRIKDIIMVFIVIGLVFCLSLQFIYQMPTLTFSQKLAPTVKWSTFYGWPTFQYCLVRNWDKMTHFKGLLDRLPHYGAQSFLTLWTWLGRGYGRVASERPGALGSSWPNLI